MARMVSQKKPQGHDFAHARSLAALAALDFPLTLHVRRQRAHQWRMWQLA